MFRLYLVACSAAQTYQIRGVEPSKKELYTKNFSCLDKSNPNAVVNDDFCDCRDGSDEPDCCDGSDEYQTNIQCPHTCDALHQEYLEEQARLEEIRKLGAQKKLELLNSAKEQLKELKRELKTAKAQLPRLLKEAEAAKNKLEALKKKEPVSEPGNFMKTIWKKASSLLGLPNIEFTKTSVKKQETSEIEITETPAASESLQEIPTANPNPESTAEPVPEVDPELEKEIEQAEQEEGEASKKVSDAESRIEQINKDLEQDNGEDDVYRTLRNECIEHTDKEYVWSNIRYTYKLCFFSDSKQGWTSLGTFSSWDKEAKIMSFTEGQTCWNGPARSTKVQLQCATENILASVSEPNKCEYLFVVGTPAECIITDADKSAREEL
ncbi:hypothetical protein HDV01_006362 [Terramyces sp. JEL0728]|nr:hypothetical protein HDV01_006362 [Terramyces sp. JEL0728]